MSAERLHPPVGPTKFDGFAEIQPQIANAGEPPPAQYGQCWVLIGGRWVAQAAEPCPCCGSTQPHIQTVSGWGCEACGCYWSVGVVVPGPTSG